MIKLINGFKSTNYFDNPLALNSFILLRYMPLLILSSDWILTENSGLYAFLGKFTLANLFKKLSLNFINDIAFYLIFLTTLTIFIVFIVIKQKQKLKGSDFRFDLQVKLLRILFFVFYFFPTYVIEVAFIFMIRIDNTSNDDNNKIKDFLNLIFKKIGFPNVTFSISGLVFSVFLLIALLIVNHFFEKFLVTPNGIHLNDLKRNMF